MLPSTAFGVQGHVRRIAWTGVSEGIPACLVVLYQSCSLALWAFLLRACISSYVCSNIHTRTVACLKLDSVCCVAGRMQRAGAQPAIALPTTATSNCFQG